MAESKKVLRPWRVNYTVTYLDKTAQHLYRERILSVLKNVAWLRGIDCAIDFDYPFFDEKFRAGNEWLTDASSDLVYFRSTRQTGISAKDFRALIDVVFSEYRMLGLPHHVEVGAQMQKVLKEYPFPKEID